MDFSIDLMHAAIEFISVACLSFIAYINFKFNASGSFSKIVGVGVGVAALSDLIHAFASLVPDLVPYWVPLSWAMSRFILLSTVAFVLYSHRFKPAIQLWSIPKLAAVPIALLLIPIVALTGFFDLSWVYGYEIIHRPLDFILMFAWLALAYFASSVRHILFPPFTYLMFMGLGALLHFNMAFFSTQSLDMAFMMAHSTKIAEYWAFILVYLLYKDSIAVHQPSRRHMLSITQHKLRRQQ